MISLHAENPIEGITRWNRGQDELERWLTQLEPPFAVMAAHDPRAAIVTRACESIGLRVPRDVAVLGVNDDTVTCETCHPQLTSIDRNGFEVGWRAAITLDRLIQGQTVDAEYVIASGSIRERESTNALAVERPELMAALNYIENRHRGAIGVEQIADACGKSRRWLEEAFRRELNCSPSDFLQRRRVQSVVEKIRTGANSTVSRLAQECGFSGGRQLNATFLRIQGQTVKSFKTAANR